MPFRPTCVDGCFSLKPSGDILPKFRGKRTLKKTSFVVFLLCVFIYVKLHSVVFNVCRKEKKKETGSNNTHTHTHNMLK